MFMLFMLCQTEASAHTWINAFFFRASAMVPLDQHMVLNLEQVVPAMTITPSSLLTISEVVDYSVVVAHQNTAGKFASIYNHLAHCIL